ncbi:hypothetical protein A3C32_02045 [Candidatus Daviesbacteria bacterium RIFCSPHIGHO2_02_FULL_41_14]|uniref:Uncharacterized protein n=1 Tax=Candidatus Daviesbacteria bacterium RIFCSPLOWO2_01_FULL_40_24 TaxID=1797787 RepID=A0A1F5MK18_9BACT|nr:MAG: hypothetical protein A2780_00680 [Candidatus Daviesbacteria bacterium RIFCSPHIGHO2_01_FULL_41_45]OGE34352.1 MAG: hypothetical protein A3C32_02045 [Candidatus Daviesbacteria bacterium RIFCSPHIGHO2_02_FULL_41_14]OGE65659.1 MAG: hypothetical protein A3B49_01680 [Candidatus Daviesbacteria bacterium RIFCSPLOWO2_01_FULL_40_24]
MERHLLTDNQIRSILESLPLFDDDPLNVKPISAREFQEIRSGRVLDEGAVCNQDALDEFQGLGALTQPTRTLTAEWRTERVWHGGPPLEDLEPGQS